MILNYGENRITKKKHASFQMTMYVTTEAAFILTFQFCCNVLMEINFVAVSFLQFHGLTALNKTWHKVQCFLLQHISIRAVAILKKETV